MTTPDQAITLLTRAAAFVRLTTAPTSVPEVLASGDGLRCPRTGQIYPYRQGVLDLLPQDLTFTATQHLLDTWVTAWLYDRGRAGMMGLFGLPAFPREVAALDQRLQPVAGDTILDLACGHGNFTVEWAKRVGPTGLVIGLDISAAMLARAARAVRDWGLTNVLLIRGDAQQLPLADGMIAKINCSGGLHQLPDLPQALREIARVSTPDAALTASTFAAAPHDRFARLKQWLKHRWDFHFVPLQELGQHLQPLGYGEYSWTLPGGWFGYAAARRTAGAVYQASSQTTAGEA
ncbi:MAG TPA: methyltransferase domain-containing protein [Herpetosiphonaceae bacterium]